MKTYSLKRFSLLVVVVVISLLPLNHYSSVVSAESCDCNENLMTEKDNSKILDGSKRIEYLNILENSSLFKKKISNKGIAMDTSQVVHMVSTDETSKVDEFIFVAGTIEKSKEDGFYAIIDINTNEVKRITHFNFQHKEENVHINDYDYDGTLVYEFDFSFEEMENGFYGENMQEIKKNSEYLNTLSAKNPPSNPKDEWWWSWSCSFISIIACMAGCVAFFPLGPLVYTVCTGACKYFWDNSLC